MGLSNGQPRTRGDTGRASARSSAGTSVSALARRDPACGTAVGHGAGERGHHHQALPLRLDCRLHPDTAGRHRGYHRDPGQDGRRARRALQAGFRSSACQGAGRVRRRCHQRTGRCVQDRAAVNAGRASSRHCGSADCRSMSAYAATWTVGQLFDQHFAKGGTLFDFDGGSAVDASSPITT